MDDREHEASSSEGCSCAGEFVGFLEELGDGVGVEFPAFDEVDEMGEVF